MANPDVVKDSLKMLVASKPGAALTADTLPAYVAVLEPIPDDVLHTVVMIYARSEGDFLPSAGSLYQKALSLIDTEPDAGTAWALVARHLRGIDVELPDRAARILTGMGGKNALQDSKAESIYRAQFFKLYESETSRDRELLTLDPSRLLEG